ncbi:hypothetical protein MN116_000968 [Schistosoma mekongi]|uniref:Protein F37C4.5 n=1 Tax=Schistosoma mekongi TaxID=38744 RepID=A0AAE2D8R3_SCHME|nr:hypothetical protein MN116_000968 [Schistosoma mekongi]
MHHHTGAIRQQEMIVVNPQTGEVLNDRYTSSNHQTNAITAAGTHHFARNITSNETVVPTSGNVNGPPVGSGSTTGQQKGSIYPKTGQNSTDGGTNGGGGVGTNSSGSGGGGARSGASVGGLDRSRQVYNMFECQMSQLTVFLDRALICRRIRPRFSASDITEVVFEHLSPTIDKDSIRVEIRGAATILDVSFSAKSLSGEEDTWSQCINELLAELRQCRRRADNLVNRIIRTEKQRCVLETFADSLSRREDEIPLSGNHHGLGTLGSLQNHATGGVDQLNNVPSQAPGAAGSITSANAQMSTMNTEYKSITDIANPYDPRNVETLHKFLEIYKDEAERYDTVLMDTNEELEQVRIRIETLEKEIHDIELKQDEHLARELSVLVEPRETGQVEMLVSYVVGRCGWKPAYDIRIFNNDGTMKIVYYGMVQQATGEDWETRYMTLSTAQPGIGGTVPHLGVQRVHFRREKSPDTNHQLLQNVDKSNIPKRTSQLPSAGAISPYSKRINANAAVFYQTPQLQRPNIMHEFNNTIPGEMDQFTYYDNSTEYYSTLGRSDSMASTVLHSSLGRRNKLYPRSRSRETIRTISQRDGITPGGTLQRGGSIENTYATGLRATSARPITRRTLGSSMLFNSVNSQSPLLSNRVSAIMNSQTTLLPTPQTITPPIGTVATIQLEVPRPPALIRCDNEPNRVTVGLLDLQPRYEYVTVPKRSLHAYLKATAVNNTEFSILAGPTNIYADNTFIGKSEIRAVAPGEEFNCHLGAENGIKILYRPLFKYREGTGSSGKNATMTFKQLIEVRNTFDRRIRLMVVDQVPVSAEDKIKVSLLEPTIKHPEKYDKNKPIRMNKYNNVEWDLDLGPGEIRELTLKYSVEHPISEDLDVSVSEV